MSEAAWQVQVVELAQRYGWLVYHPFDSRRSTPGFPDLTMAHPRAGRLVFAELKSETGRLSAAQVMWNAALQKVDAGLEAAGAGDVVSVHVWKPSDFDEVHDVLRLAR